MEKKDHFNLNIGSTLRQNLIELSLLFKVSCSDMGRIALHHFYDDVMGYKKKPSTKKEEMKWQ